MHRTCCMTLFEFGKFAKRSNWRTYMVPEIIVASTICSCRHFCSSPFAPTYTMKVCRCNVWRQPMLHCWRVCVFLWVLGVAPDHADTKTVIGDFSKVASDPRCKFLGNVAVRKVMMSHWRYSCKFLWERKRATVGYIFQKAQNILTSLTLNLSWYLCVLDIWL